MGPHGIKVSTRQVLAGAYKGGRKSLANMRTHLVMMVDDRDSVVGCKQPLDNLVDHIGADEGEPTCKTCAAKYRKLVAQGSEVYEPKETVYCRCCGGYHEQGSFC